jgi:hypothetical protein
MTPHVGRDQHVTVRYHHDDIEIEERFAVINTTPPWLELGRHDAGTIPRPDTIVDLLIGNTHVRATVQRTTPSTFIVLRPVQIELAPNDPHHSWNSTTRPAEAEQ